MSEFKFACPVCGQHITADSGASGGKLECPTCFRKIVVPQAPASADSKFILSASQADKPRPPQSNPGAPEVLQLQPKPVPIGIFLAVAALVCGAGAAAYVFRDKLFKPAPRQSQVVTNQPAKEVKAPPPPPAFHPVPTNINWTLNLTNTAIPEAGAVGGIHGKGFVCERATLQGGTLTLRQGRSGPTDFGIVIRLFAQQGEELSGKAVEVTADRIPPLPRVTLRWRDEGQPKASTEDIREGYAMKLVFGPAANERIPARIYICLPDEAKSFVAGTFEAEIRKPNPPKKKGKG